MAIKFKGKKSSLTFKKSNTAKHDRLTLRLSGKERFAIELLALKEGVTVSRIIMRTLEPTLKAALTIEQVKGSQKENIYIPDASFDSVPPDRLVKLALIAPNFLSETDAVIWKVIQEDTSLWDKGKPNFKMIRESWKAINKTAQELVDTYSNEL